MGISSPLVTPTKTANQKSSKQQPPVQESQAKAMELRSAKSFRTRFEAYNRLQGAAVAFGEKLPIPEIVALGGQSDGKSSLLEALLGFRFNVREVEMGTRRPLILQMVHEPSASEPRCRFQEEDSDDYGSPIVSSSAIAEVIKSRTDSHLKKSRTTVSPKPIVMRAEYAHCPNLTIIDTPGFVLKAKKGEPDNTPDEILSMVKELASPPHRLLLFLQQSSVEWCSSLWLDALRSVDPTLRRTIVVVSKFDNRLKEFTDRWEVDRYLSASGYLGDSTRPFFVALPKDRGVTSNEEFRRQISQVDSDIIHHLRENVKGGFDEEKYASFIGFGCLRDYLELELQRRYKEAAPATLALLEQRCAEVAVELARTDTKLQATSNVASLRRLAMLHAASISRHVWALIDGAADPTPEEWGKTTDEERLESGFGSWPGVVEEVKPPNSLLKLYGGAAFQRVMHEFRCATHSIECPTVSREKVANILLAHAGRGGGGGAAGAAVEIARAAARSWLAPLLDTACDRLAYVLRNLFDLAAERNKNNESLDDERWKGSMDGYVGFHAALRHSYNQFIHDLAKQCKHLVRHHLDSVTSPYSQICYYDSDSFGSSAFGATSIHRCNFSSSFTLFGVDLSGRIAQDNGMDDQENQPPKAKAPLTNTPGKSSDKEVLRESQMTIPETPSPDQPGEPVGAGKKRDHGNHADPGMRKRHMRIMPSNTTSLDLHQRNGNLFGGANDHASRTGSAYSEVCSAASQHFARIREVLIERSLPSTLNSGFLSPCRDRLMVALGLDLFAVNDERFMDMFVAPGAVDVLRNERESLQKRQKILQSCLTEFKNVARAL
ncbi:dynamin-related protein 5A [Nymphaea colorata]|nr:dynamin-related protein 5A [Nymphaea colorata]XP_031479975.1 dynamin-related protein 5A [Nymphaea colorata]XP_031480058.1 dynamin-related protein 5A [Nymphaea colorata]